MSIPETIRILWEARIFWCAYVIGFSSVLFPFLKLFSLAIIWALPRHSHCCRSFLRHLAYAGRLSLLDVFVVIFIMIMAYDQYSLLFTPLFSTTVHNGFILFVSGVCLNMLSSEAMVLLEIKQELG
jgi:uncharacterized paraquat-inducible protein A